MGDAIENSRLGDAIDANGRRYVVENGGEVRVDDSLSKAPLPEMRLPMLSAAPSCGKAHCLAVSAAGKLLSWATARSGNRFGQLGAGANGAGEGRGGGGDGSRLGGGAVQVVVVP